ncbi:mucin-5AC-like [Platichthys flesus]|uniref:mucin-5AC-like n=1 Tax=Platichthys flesus TaxID=8260 RepID=UPI002DBE1BEA|nr:mucin-5AC-like [Platichthys flesus]XP_062267737.1 mucin-5AC-like [Platichthys flesus]
MIKLLCVAIVAGLVFESNQQRLEAKKLEPEKLELNQLEPEKQELNQLEPFLVKPVPTKFPCDYPTHIQCWTDWFDRDDPTGSGDWELLYNLRIENPGKICPKPIQIEAKTLTGLSAAAAGDVIFKSDSTTGFICKNQDQKSKKMCNDYRVRFSCHPPFCGGVCWTDWYDRDRPSGTGDWELLSNLKKENPGQICDSPMYIEAVTTDTMTPAISTGENFLHYNPTVGFVCRKADQIDGECLNYKVRFGCPCK